MNNVISQIQHFLAQSGAPAWLQEPWTWAAIGSGTVVMLLVLRMLFKRRGTAEAAERPVQTGGGVFGPWTEAFASQIPESDKERQEFGALLRQAGMYSRTARASVYAYRFLLLTFPLFCAGLLAVFSPAEQTWKILFAGGAVAVALSIIPRLYVWYCRKVRLAEIGAGLADMLDMLSMCLGGGMSISASLDHVAKNLASYPALAEELQIMRRQSEVGSLKMALVDWANRVDSPDVRQVATLLARGDSLGTALSGSLLEQADHFRTARKQLATLQANRMPVFLTFPLLFCFAPAVLIVLMSPALLQISDFLNSPDNPLANNERIGTGRIVQSLNELNQDVSAAARPATFVPAAPVTTTALYDE